MTTWYYRNDTGEIGPLPPEQFKQLATNGEISSETPIRRADMDQWVYAKSVKGLLPAQTATALAEPSPPIDPFAGTAVSGDTSTGEAPRRSATTRRSRKDGSRPGRKSAGKGRASKDKGRAAKDKGRAAKDNMFQAPDADGLEPGDYDDDDVAVIRLIEPLYQSRFPIAFMAWTGMIGSGLMGVIYPPMFLLGGIGPGGGHIAVLIGAALFSLAVAIVAFFMSFKLRIGIRDIRHAYEGKRQKKAKTGIRSLAASLRISGICTIVYVSLIVLAILAGMLIPLLLR